MGVLLSAYRIMWVYVLFDLPTNTKRERKEARQFREGLLNLAFSMIQFSVYARHCMGQDQVATLSGRVRGVLPKGGRVDILVITDKQFSNIITYESKKRKKNEESQQLLLF